MGIEVGDSPTLTDILLGIFIGVFVIGPIVWTELGRKMAVEAIRRGAGVAEEKVHEWLEKGEK